MENTQYHWSTNCPSTKICIHTIYGQSPINIIWLTMHKSPNCTLCPNNDKDTRPCLLSACTHQHIIGLKMAKQYKVVRLILQTLKVNKSMWFLTLANARTKNDQPPPQLYMVGYYHAQAPTTGKCMAKLRLYILCIIEDLNHDPNTFNSKGSPTSTNTI